MDCTLFNLKCSLLKLNSSLLFIVSIFNPTQYNRYNQHIWLFFSEGKNILCSCLQTILHLRNKTLLKIEYNSTDHSNECWTTFTVCEIISLVCLTKVVSVYAFLYELPWALITCYSRLLWEQCWVLSIRLVNIVKRCGQLCVLAPTISDLQTSIGVVVVHQSFVHVFWGMTENDCEIVKMWPDRVGFPVL